MGGSILLPNWSAYSGTPSQMVALKVVNMINVQHGQHGQHGQDGQDGQDGQHGQHYFRCDSALPT